jgi:electron transfer flavoprotein alpha subunit
MNSAKKLSFLGRRQISTLLVIEQQQGKPSSGNAHALSAAQKLGFPITALVSGTPDHATQASKIVCQYPGVSTVLVAKGAQFEHNLAEPNAELIANTAGKFSHVVAAHTGYAKNVFPRAAALLDVSPISDITEIDSADTFKRPIYAGSAIATVQSSDKIKLFTVRTTAFAALELTGGNAKVEDCEVVGTGMISLIRNN